MTLHRVIYRTPRKRKARHVLLMAGFSLVFGYLKA
jgi:hypothetical protein